MTIKHLLPCASLALICLLTPPMAAAQPVSPAETLLFQTPHLDNLGARRHLVYTFDKPAGLEPAFTGEVLLDVKVGADGKTAASTQFLSGARAVKIPPVEYAQGNPVLMGYLEREIGEMQRLTGGARNYFRKRIRLALAQGASIAPATVRFDGRELPASEVSIAPYLDDPLRARMPKYEAKRYTFVLSPQVPGGLYQIRTSLAGADETLTLTKARP